MLRILTGRFSSIVKPLAANAAETNHFQSNKLKITANFLQSKFNCLTNFKLLKKIWNRSLGAY